MKQQPITRTIRRIQKRRIRIPFRLLDIVPMLRALMSILVIAAGCSPGGNRDTTVPSEDGPTASASVTEVSVAEAEALLEAEGELVVLDVRTPENSPRGI